MIGKELTQDTDRPAVRPAADSVVAVRETQARELHERFWAAGRGPRRACRAAQSFSDNRAPMTFDEALITLQLGGVELVIARRE